jgi:hypothetical protein
MHVILLIAVFLIKLYIILKFGSVPDELTAVIRMSRRWVIERHSIVLKPSTKEGLE